jgi:hypothetical protein
LLGATVTWADTVTVALIAAQLVVLIVAAFVAWRQVREARELREEQQRPFVVVDFDLQNGYMTFLEVVNLGTSLARDVRIEIDPPLASASDVDFADLKMLNEGIATLAPGKKYRTFFDMGFRRAKSDLPMNYTAFVSYTDEKGRRSFNETLNLDLDLFMNLVSITRHDVHDVNKRLEEIRDLLKKWTSNLPGGLLVMNPDEQRNETTRIVADTQERREKTQDADE